MPSRPPAPRRLLAAIAVALAAGLLPAAACDADGPASKPCPGVPEVTQQEMRLSTLSRSARLVPEIRDGKTTGVRVYSLRPESALARIGVRNGEIIRKIADLEILSHALILNAHARMQSLACPSLTIERDGQALELPFHLLP